MNQLRNLVKMFNFFAIYLIERRGEISHIKMLQPELTEKQVILHELKTVKGLLGQGRCQDHLYNSYNKFKVHVECL